MRPVNHRFQNLIIRIVHSRLLLAASLEDRKLILECYHPSAQYTEPYLFCDYLGTAGLSDSVPGHGSIYEAQTGDGLLRRLYSRFRPSGRRPDSGTPRSHPAGDIPGSRTSDLATARAERQEDANDVVKRMLNFDAHENFSQLVFSTDLVQLGPHRGLFSDIVKVNDKKTLRVFRDWAAHRATETQRSPPVHTKERRRSEPLGTVDHEITWIDDRREKVGVKLKVEERRWRRDTPILLRADEERAAAYSIELQGKPGCTMAGNDVYFLVASDTDAFQNSTSVLYTCCWLSSITSSRKTKMTLVKP